MRGAQGGARRFLLEARAAAERDRKGEARDALDFSRGLLARNEQLRIGPQAARVDLGAGDVNFTLNPMRRR